MRKRNVCDETNLIKYGRLADACKRYSLGAYTMRRVARDAGAVVHVGTACLINFDKVDEYMEELAG